MPLIEFTLQEDFITLGQLLKHAGLIGSGGEARMFLAENEVFVNGEQETRRGRKLRSGDNVAAPGGIKVEVLGTSQPGGGSQ